MLSKFHLPAHVRERPNDYFPLLPALRFATEAQPDELAPLQFDVIPAQRQDLVQPRSREHQEADYRSSG